MTYIVRGAALAAGLLGLTLAAGAHASDTCAALAAQALPDATITRAQVVAAGTYVMPQNPLSQLAKAPGMSPTGRIANGPNPAFCQIAATLKPSSDSDIKVEVWLPLKGWNG